MMKVNNEGAREGLREVQRAIRLLLAGNYKVIECR
jgi:hypothetical protein